MQNYDVPRYEPYQEIGILNFVSKFMTVSVGEHSICVHFCLDVKIIFCIHGHIQLSYNEFTNFTLTLLSSKKLQCTLNSILMETLLYLVLPPKTIMESSVFGRKGMSFL